MFPVFLTSFHFLLKKPQGSPDQNVLELGNNAWELGLAKIPRCRRSAVPEIRAEDPTPVDMRRHHKDCCFQLGRKNLPGWLFFKAHGLCFGDFFWKIFFSNQRQKLKAHQKKTGLPYMMLSWHVLMISEYIWCLFFTILTKEKQAQRHKSFPGLDSKAVALKSWLAWHFALVLLRSNAILADLPLINELVVFHQPIWKIWEPSNWVHLPQFSGWTWKIFEFATT